MNNTNFTREELSKYSKEELIDLIQNLPKQSGGPNSNAEELKNTSANNNGITFRKKFAEKILESLPDMLTVVTDTGTVVEIVSSEETNHTGIHSDHIFGVSLNQFLPEHVYNNVMYSIEKARELQGQFTVNHMMMVDGKEHYMENRTVRIADNYSLCICRDTTESSLAKQQLEQVKYAVNHVKENIYAVDADGFFIFANKQFIKDHKQTDPIKGLVYEVMYTLRSKEEWEVLKNNIRANNGTLEYIANSRMSDINRTYEVVTNLLHDENNNEIFWFFVRDVSERQKQEAKIHELNDLMEAILNNIPVYLFVKDTADDFRYLYWNRAFEKHSGIPTSTAVGSKDFDIFPSQADAQKFRDDDLRLIENGKLDEFTEVYQSKDLGERILKTVKMLVPRSGTKPLLIGVSWDITDIKETEKQLIEAKIEAEQSNLLKTAFIANMSHEIRTPLNAIVGFSRLISSCDDPEEKQQFSDIIDSNADLLLQLINDILDLSKIEAGTLEFVSSCVNLNEICNTAFEVHRFKLKSNVSLILDPSPSDCIVKCDRNRLMQVCTNLLTNAIKFTSQGEIHFGYVINGDKIEVYVRDTGIGIAPDKLSNIFERFVKLNAFAQGSGLGLSISKMIVERIGGTISATSHEGVGTEFRFTIPYDANMVEFDFE